MTDAEFVEMMAQPRSRGRFAPRSHELRILDRSVPEPTTGCFLWAGAINGHGYGSIWRSGKVFAAHRVAWEQERGPVPDGFHVLHLCDVRSCVNPDHLYLGTNADNCRDRDVRGRSNHAGQHNGNSAYWREVRAALARRRT